MAPSRKQEKGGNSSESTPKFAASDKNPPKLLKPKRKLVKKILVRKSVKSGETGISLQKAARDMNANDARVSELENNEIQKVGKKTPNSLKPKRKLVKKSVAQNTAQREETRRDLLRRAKNENESQVKESEDTKRDTRKDDAAESSSKLMVPEEKPLQAGKPVQEVAMEPSTQEPLKAIETEMRSQGQTTNKERRKRIKKSKQQSADRQRDSRKNPNSRHRGHEKEQRKETQSKASLRNCNSKKDIGGLIFMCNAKTKPDCFRFQIFGISASKQEIVMDVRPGLKLFLFDFDLKLMYGIYQASSAGGMKLEPAAFGGAFPAQVRFTIHRDCLPLPESVFKRAIRDNYDERTHKFRTELTVEQVKRLMELFRPAPCLQSNVKPSALEPVLHAAPASALPVKYVGDQQFRDYYSCTGVERRILPRDHERKQISEHRLPSSEGPLFLTETEYRTHGLRQAAKLSPSAVSPHVGHSADHFRSDIQNEHLRGNPGTFDASLVRKESGHHDPYFPSEKEYRTYGLKGCRNLPGTAPTVETNHASADPLRNPFNPYDDSTVSLVNRYLSLPRSTASHVESYPVRGRETYINSPHYRTESRGYTARIAPDEEREYLSHASLALSEYNQKFNNLGGQPDLPPTTVSSRYSFASPYVQRR